MGGIASVYPVLSMVFFISFFSLVGTPPLSGFWPKLLLIQGALQSEHYYLIAGIILASFLTLWAVVRVWSKVFWSNVTEMIKSDDNEYSRMRLIDRVGLVFPVGLLAGLSVLISFMWPAVAEWCIMVADQLINPEGYIEAVLKTKN
jgi:multicomponent Na+:H+ antiporter subunit D